MGAQPWRLQECPEGVTGLITGGFTASDSPAHMQCQLVCRSSHAEQQQPATGTVQCR